MSKKYCLISICPLCKARMEVGEKGTSVIPLQFNSIEDAMRAKKAYKSGSGFLSAYGFQPKGPIELPDYFECRECGVVTPRESLEFFVQEFPAPRQDV